MDERLPIGVCLGSIGVSAAWWLESARRLEAAGYRGVWCWDHFISRGDRTRPVLEAWTTITAAAALTHRLEIGPFVANVMNRHPAVLARMAATLHEVSGGRLTLAIGIGGHPGEHAAMGIPFPPPAERVARLREAVAVLRALWRGEPVSRPSPYYPLLDAVARPALPEPPRIIVGGETTAGARLAAEVADGWTAFVSTFERDEPRFRDALDAAGRDRSDTRVSVAFGRPRELRAYGWLDEPRAALARWQEAGADDVILTARTESDLTGLIVAAERW